MNNKLLLLFTITTLTGLIFSIELTRIHHQTYTNPDFNSICAINTQVNCETVARSPYAVFLEIPVSVWAIFAYTFLLLLSLSGFFKSTTWSILFILSKTALLATLALAYISHFIIESLCIYCAALYLVNLLLLCFSGLALITNKQNPIKTFWPQFLTIFSQKNPALIFTPLILAAVIVTYIFIPRYWLSSGWNDLKPQNEGITEDGSYYIGSENPLITITEFSDYQCPYCRNAHKQMRLLVEKYQDSVRLVHKNLPMDHNCNRTITQFYHDRACEFSLAAVCAGKQGSFWRMNDALFSIQESVPSSMININALAGAIGLDINNFKECLISQIAMDKIKTDIEKSIKLGVLGTPTFFLGPQPFPGGFGEQILRNALKHKKQ